MRYRLAVLLVTLLPLSPLSAQSDWLEQYDLLQWSPGQVFESCVQGSDHCVRVEAHFNQYGFFEAKVFNWSGRPGTRTNPNFVLTGLSFSDAPLRANLDCLEWNRYVNGIPEEESVARGLCKLPYDSWRTWLSPDVESGRMGMRGAQIGSPEAWGGYGGLTYFGFFGTGVLSSCAPLGAIQDYYWVTPTCGFSSLVVGNPERTWVFLEGESHIASSASISEDGPLRLAGVHGYLLPSTTTPEPASTLLLGSGLAALASLRRRRRNAE